MKRATRTEITDTVKTSKSKPLDPVTDYDLTVSMLRSQRDAAQYRGDYDTYNSAVTTLRKYN